MQLGCAGDVAHEGAHLIAALGEPFGEAASDLSGRSGDEDLHAPRLAIDDRRRLEETANARAAPRPEHAAFTIVYAISLRRRCALHRSLDPIDDELDAGDELVAIVVLAQMRGDLADEWIFVGIERFPPRGLRLEEIGALH